MSSVPTNRNRHGTAPRTLGDLLFADKSKLRVPETEWVALVRAIGAGDQSALRMLYERTHGIVFTLTIRLTGNQQTAEELTLDVFQHVWHRAATYDSHAGSVLGWIANLARSRAIDRLLYEQRQTAAARLDQPLGTIKNRNRSGLEKLRMALAAGKQRR